MKEHRIKKALFNGKDSFDFHRLMQKKTGLVDLSIIESGEELLLVFNTERLTCASEIYSEGEEFILGFLLSVAGLIRFYGDLFFSLSPDNLYFDAHGNALVAVRDVYASEAESDIDVFICEYKALIGSLLQNQYTFSDYREGGEDLLKQNPLLKQIFEMSNLEEIDNYLYERLCKTRENRKKNMKLVSVGQFHRLRTLLFFMILSLVIGGGYSIYRIMFVEPMMQARQKAMEAYLESDFVGMIDALKRYPLAAMNHYDKYLLSIAYIHGEHLTKEQKQNIFAALDLDGNEAYFDYWIRLGRLETAAAQEIGMRLSENQLILYALLKERDMLEQDTKMDGMEKGSRLAELDRQIEELAKIYQEDMKDNKESEKE